VGYRSVVRHAAWLILATLVVGVLPGSLAPVALRSHRANAPLEHKERCKEQVDAEPLKLLVVAQRKGHAGPTRGWLTLRAPHRHKPRPQFLPLSYGYEDPRRVLIPLRIDPPPDGRV
jgi:hypothetical protein